MKVSKRVIVFLVSLAISIVVFPITFKMYKEFYVKPFLLSKPVGGYIDYEPFFSTWYGISTIMVWASLTVLWLLHSMINLMEKLKQNQKTVFNVVVVALKSVVLSMAHMDYQMEFKKRKRKKAKKSCYKEKARV